MASTLIQSIETQDPDSAARILSRLIGYPVTFLTYEGQVLGASSDLPFQIRGISVKSRLQSWVALAACISAKPCA